MVKSWQSKVRSATLPISLVVMAGLFVWALPRFATWTLSVIRPNAVPDHPKFEAAYQNALSLGQRASGYASALGSLNTYGIRQLDYDQWRQLNGKSINDLSRIREEEVKAVYWMYWQKGNCERAESPLDVACLDSLASFGVQQGKNFLVNLPSDPQQAAMEIARRREVTRRQMVHPPITPGKQLAIQEGLRRDRALADFVVAADRPLLPALVPAPVPSPVPALPIPSPPSFSPSPLTPEPPIPTELTAEQIYQKVKLTTVEIWNTSQPGIASTASGVILTANGLVLTNYHVVASNSAPTVKLVDGRKFTATVMSVDPELDLALLQLNGVAALPTTAFSQTSVQVKVGDTVYAIGSPRGKSWTMSTAQVIELNSTCANGASSLRCIRTPGNFLHPGNSGGPLIDRSGQVIGINRAVQQSTGEGVSIPVETIQSFLNQRMGQSQAMDFSRL